MRLQTPDGDVALFTAYFDNVLSRVNNEKKTCYISGDYNINLLKCDTRIPTVDFANCIFLIHSCQQ